MKRTILITFLFVLAVAAGSRSFNGTTDLITVAANARINDLSPLTILCWQRPVNTGEVAGRYIDKGGNTAWFIVTGGHDFRVLFSGNDVLRTTQSSQNPANTWTHLAATWDGSTNGTGIRLYANGVEVTSYSATGNATGSRDSDAAADLIIGNNAAASRTYNGRISHLQIYNRELSAGEITTLMHKPGKILSGCVGYWPLFGVASPEPDWSGGGLNGTLTGTSVADGPPVGPPF